MSAFKIIRTVKKRKKSKKNKYKEYQLFWTYVTFLVSQDWELVIFLFFIDAIKLKTNKSIKTINLKQTKVQNE